MTENEKYAYLAGLIDGEGTLTIFRDWQYKGVKGNYTKKFKRYRIRLSITNTDVAMLDWLVNNFGGHYTVRNKAHEHHKTAYSWQDQSQEGIKILLTGCLPFLITKRQHAELLLKYVNIRQEKSLRQHKPLFDQEEDEIYDAIKKLNDRYKHLNS